MAKKYNLEFTRLDPSEINDRLEKLDFHWKKPLKIKTYDDVFIYPAKGMYGGVIDSNGLFVDGTALHEGIRLKKVGQPIKASVVRHRTAVFLGTWLNVYGHCITDNIKRLWFFNLPNLLNNYKDVDFIYCSEETSSVMEQILCTLGLDYRELIRIDKVTYYDRVYIPDSSIIYQNVTYFSDEIIETVSKITSFCQSKFSVYYEKIYLSRTSFSRKKKKDFGEIAIEQSFRANGFEVIYPEQFAFMQQVYLLQHCKCLACTEGSVSHNSIFCKNGTQIILLRKANYINRYQIMINEMKKLDVTYIDAHHSLPIKDPWCGPFFMWRTKQFNKFWNKSKNSEECIWFSILWYEYLFNYCCKIFENLVSAISHYCNLPFFAKQILVK